MIYRSGTGSINPECDDCFLDAITCYVTIDHFLKRHPFLPVTRFAIV
ncbi:MAG TPA: hypothetical protein VFV61_08280 [Pyrinomonadaceae bacterium]|nr:hypothetical protein [Pyrinomonadaceae bacterium]